MDVIQLDILNGLLNYLLYNTRFHIQNRPLSNDRRKDHFQTNIQHSYLLSVIARYLFLFVFALLGLNAVCLKRTLCSDVSASVEGNNDFEYGSISILMI